MKSTSKEIRTTTRSAFVVMWLVTCCVLATGCDQLMGDLLKQEVEKSEDDTPKRNAFSAAFKQLKEQCPQEVNEYLTLEKVRLKDLDKIEFRYSVTDVGRTAVSASTRRPLRQVTIARLLAEPIAESMIDLDLDTSHSFKDLNGVELVSFNVSKLDLLRAQKKIEKGEDTTEKAQQQLKLALEESNQPEKKASVEQAASVDSSVESEVSEPNASPNAKAKLPVTVEAVADELPKPKEKPWHVEKIKPNSARTTDNPAGVRTNPFAK